MATGSSLSHAVSALRTALGYTAMTRFDAPLLAGPTPQAGRVIENVESWGRHVEIEWDNGMVLHTQLRRSGSWHVYRQGENWQRRYDQMSVSIENEAWVAVCFDAQLVETFRRPDKRRHPGMGRLAPNVGETGADLGRVVNLLLSYEDAEARIGDVLLDQRVMFGLGNVLRCEVLFDTGVSPFGQVGDLTEGDAVRIVNQAASKLRANLQRSSSSTDTKAMSVYGRNGQECPRCPGTIEFSHQRRTGRPLYWCPDCQRHLDPMVHQQPDDTPVMDTHPATARFLADLPWNRVG